MKVNADDSNNLDQEKQVFSGGLSGTHTSEIRLDEVEATKARVLHANLPFRTLNLKPLVKSL